MKAKNIKKYGVVFYRRILVISLSVMLLLSIIISIIINAVLTNSSLKSIEKIELSYSEKISQNYINSLNAVTSISNYFSTLKTMPFDYVNITTNAWMKNIMSSTLDSYRLNYSYITGMNVNIANYDFSSGQYTENEKTKLSEYNGIKISICEENSWPHYAYFNSINNIYNVNHTSLLVNLEAFSSEIFLEQDSSRNEYIITSSGKILLSNNDSQIFCSIYDFYSLESLEKRFYEYSSSNGTYYITSTPIQDTEFFYISVINTDFYYGTTRSAFIKSIILGVAITVFSLALVYVIVYFNYRPIKDIVSIITSYYPNDEIDENEINFIKKRIKRTIEDKQSLEKQLPETVKKLNHAQMAALHSQINPHFLFNTLENIIGLSMEKYGVDNDIERPMILLNKIVFESIGQKNMVFSLRNEIAITENYIELMLMRFGNKFTAVWDVDESVMNAKILKFSLQPIIENSIIKGFTKKRTDYIINIDIKCNSKDIIITVKDNGNGMSPEILENLLRSINDTVMSEKHIGLKNLNIRSKLLYGTNYGISKIESNAGGTSVELVIPLLLD